MDKKPASNFPNNLLFQVFNWFWNTHNNISIGSQACLVALIYYHPRDYWMIYIPKQFVQHGVVEYEPPADNEILHGYQLAGSITSHGSMKSYFSQTELMDAKSYGRNTLHISVGEFPEEFEGIQHWQLGISIGQVDGNGVWNIRFPYDVLEGVCWNPSRDDAIDFYPPVEPGNHVFVGSRPMTWSKSVS